jgi:hypothetical protein
VRHPTAQTSEARHTDALIVNNGTKVLGASTLAKVVNPSGAPIDLAQQNVNLRFRKAGPTLKHLAPGDIIVSGVTAQTPFGMLRRVDRVRRVGKQERVVTSPASLIDAFAQAAFDFQHVISVCLPVDSSFAPSATSGGTGGGGTIHLTGQLCVDGTVRVMASWGLGQPIDAEFSLTGTETATFDLAATGNLSSVALETDSPSKPVPTLRPFPVPYTPIAISLGFQLVSGVQGKMEAGVTGHVKQVAPFSTTIHCTGDSNCLADHSFDSSIPEKSLSPKGAFGLKPYLGLRTTAFIDDVQGPYGQVDGFVRASADAVTLCPQLGWGVEGSIGYKADLNVLGINVLGLNVSANLPAKEWNPLSLPCSYQPPVTLTNTPTATPVVPTSTPTPTAPPPILPPASVTNVQANALDAHDIQLTWNDNSTNEDGYYVCPPLAFFAFRPLSVSSRALTGPSGSMACLGNAPAIATLPANTT